MESLQNRIKCIKKEFKEALAGTKTLKNLDALRIRFIGKKGTVVALFQELKKVSVEEKKECGPLLNNLKKEIEGDISTTKEKIIVEQNKTAQLKKQNFDVTAEKPLAKSGSIHIYSQVVEEIENIFLSMGFDVLDGPEVESDFYNFEALNIPADHPARDMYDTFWVKSAHTLLRTHTSPMQIKAMEKGKLPIAAVVPGRTFRHEAVDASHDVMFMQCEGFLIGKNVTLSHLFAVAQTFLKKLFNKNELDIRIRPGYFPFVEPGVEIDMRCPFCKNGCSVCKKSTWLEVFPGGLIHPNVLKAGGVDPEKYSGFAFGFGLTRLVMLKHGINDIRLLSNGKMKFLEQF
jgi:phenylalanyl-tRNA synthetase alpha chain